MEKGRTDDVPILHHANGWLVMVICQIPSYFTVIFTCLSLFYGMLSRFGALRLIDCEFLWIYLTKTAIFLLTIPVAETMLGERVGPFPMIQQGGAAGK